MPSAVLTVPNVAKAVWPAMVVTGKAGAALVAGDLVVSTDSITFNKTAVKSYISVKGIVINDATKDSYATGDVLPVLVLGIGVAVAKAAVACGDLLQNDVTDAGKVLKYAVGSDTAETAQQAVLGRALTAASADGDKILVGVRW